MCGVYRGYNVAVVVMMVVVRFSFGVSQKVK
jgi:hypothetical protein